VLIPLKQILGLMDQLGIKPDIVTYSHQSNASASLGHMAECMEIFDKADEGRRSASHQSNASANRCVRQMKDAGVLPNVVISNTLLKGFLDANDMTAVDSVSLENHFMRYISILLHC
jgi:pentatricopeptide repeat domain-containing protein 1